ncbi:MAG: arginase family protein [Anaerolineae bacterium]|nr:arginase family protein [Anaerolineae bacterium]
MGNFTFFAVPHDLGNIITDRTEMDDLKSSGIAEAFGASWVDVVPDFDHAPNPMTAVHRAIADAILRHPNQFPVVFAADCVTSIGMVRGLTQRHGEMGIVWYDAHGDFNTPATTPSGYIGGMPLAMLVGRGEQDLMRGAEVRPLNEAHIVITDARDLDPGEREALAASRILHLPDVAELLTAPLPHVPLYVHFDTDVVNLEEMPGMNYPAPGGPSLDTAADTLQRVAHDGEVVGVLFGLWDTRMLTPDNHGVPIAATHRLMQALADGLAAKG